MKFKRHKKSVHRMQDRRQSPRIKFPISKEGFYVTLYLKRFFFKDRKIICKLRDLSDGGASVLITGNDRKHVSESSIGAGAHLVSESAEVSFKLEKKGKVMRVIQGAEGLTVVVAFTHQKNP